MLLHDALSTDNPVVGCAALPAVTRPSYIPSLSCIEPELHCIEVYVCVTKVTCVKGPSLTCNVLLVN